VNRLSRLLSSIALLAAGLAAVNAHAAEVKIPHHGLALNAELDLAPGKAVRDGIVLMVHGTLGHARLDIMQGLQAAYRAKGRNTLAINLSLGINDRHGDYDCTQAHRHRHTDALEEIAAWLAWAKQQGAKDIVLLGHARGGNQVAWFMAERDDATVDTVVLVAPLVSYAAQVRAEYEQRFGVALAPVLERAKAMVAAGHGSGLLAKVGFLHCQDTTVSADSFVSYYDEDRRMDTAFLLRKYAKHAVIFSGTQDTVVTGLESRMMSLADGKRIKLVSLDGADHMFRGPYRDDVVAVVREFRNQAFEADGKGECE
jgi:pimeloyl-ACP methyl ester carboxylesterase